jgi:hypothetical protein
MDETLSRQYAREYCCWIEDRLNNSLAPQRATAAQVYAAYNVGITLFIASRCDVAKLNAITRAKCALFN